MDNENPDVSQEETRQMPPDPWSDVGRQFETLGNSLASAFKTSFDTEENRRLAQDLKGDLQSMLDHLSKSVDKATDTEQVQQVKDEAMKAAESLRQAGEHTYEGARPHLVSFLRSLNEGVQNIITHIEESSTKPPEPPASA